MVYKMKCYTRIVELSAMHMSAHMWLHRRQSLPVNALRAHSFGVMDEVVHGGRRNVVLVKMWGECLRDELVGGICCHLRRFLQALEVRPGHLLRRGARR